MPQAKVEEETFFRAIFGSSCKPLSTWGMGSGQASGKASGARGDELLLTHASELPIHEVTGAIQNMNTGDL